MDKVAILMSTYNGEKYLREQIDSILFQKGVEVTLYIRDDGSSDGTIDIVKKYQPITGKEIGERLYLTRSALRTDFSILTGMKILESKPKIGYSYIEKKDSEKVKDIMGPSITVDTNLSVYETILNIFSKDVGTIFITDQGSLVGVVSRKDLLKIAIGRTDIEKIDRKSVV